MRPIIALAVVLVTSGCAAPEPKPPTPAPPPPPDVVSDRFEHDGRTYVLTAYAWRDFMPRIGPDRGDPPLFVVMTLTPSEGNELPKSVAGARSWVVHAQGSWHADLDATEPRRAYPDRMEFVARGGPPWRVGDPLTVYLELEFEDAETVAVRRPGVVIERTD